MSNNKIMLSVTLLAILMTSMVLGATRQNGEMDSLEPPQMVIETEETRINGVMGEYCEEELCVEHLDPENPTTEATLLPMIKPRIDRGEEISFVSDQEREFEKVEYEIKEREDNRIIEKGSYRGESIEIEKEGRYFIVAEAHWDDRNVVYTYQVDVGK